MKEPEFIITAVNSLTGEREAVSNPHRIEVCRKMLAAHRRRSSKQLQAPFSKYRIERNPAASDQWLPFAPPLKIQPSDCNSVNL